MKLIIHYESSWRASFLNGSNNEPISDEGRTFIGSSVALKKKENQKYRAITKNTVMGILNRLIGDQRRLYQSRASDDYYFEDIEASLSDSHIKDDSLETEEITFIRNARKGSFNKTNYSGLIDSSAPAFCAPYAKRLWSILFLSTNDVVAFINGNDEVLANAATPSELDALVVADRLTEIQNLNAEKPENNPQWDKAIRVLSERFIDVDYALTVTGAFLPRAFYMSAIYLLLDRLTQAHDMSELLTRGGLIAGISKRGFTRSDFIRPFTTGGRCLAIGSPYQFDSYEKGVGKTTQTLKVASGTLTVHLPLDYGKAKELASMIDNAGVGAFKMGKKGLAYLSHIELPAPSQSP